VSRRSNGWDELVHDLSASWLSSRTMRL
jgi:hypothetical protein